MCDVRGRPGPLSLYFGDDLVLATPWIRKRFNRLGMIVPHGYQFLPKKRHLRGESRGAALNEAKKWASITP